ncbi:MAG: hypothetical protein PHN44_08645 [Candidatus Marinimicrobia bacterium]|nr:hypothetical protein [Candidatus Neomarinimicrobiota bacterium]
MEIEKIEKIAAILGIDISDFGYSEDYMLERYDEYLSELGEVQIGSLSYDPANALKEVDPTAYRCGFVDWLDSERDIYVEFDGAYFDDERLEELIEEIKDRIDGLS